MYVDEKSYAGELIEKVEARKEFENEKEKGNLVVLAEQKLKEERVHADKIMISIGNILP